MTSSQVAEFRTKLNELLTAGGETIAVDQKDIERIKKVDQYVSCFINWRRGDVDAAVKMAISVLQWRKERNINALSVNDFDEELLQRGIIFSHGHALDGTRIVYFIARRQTKDIKADVQNMLCLWLERLHQQETGKHITYILDVSKTNMSNVDLGGIRFLLDCFTTYFPDMLERIVILEMPWIMNAIWKVVKQWMTERQRQRTAFVSFKDLNQFVASDNILSYMGGEDSWTYNYPLPADYVPSLTLMPSYEETQDDVDSLEDVTEEEYVIEDVEITVTEADDVSVVPVSGGDATNNLLPVGDSLPQSLYPQLSAEVTKQTLDVVTPKPQKSKIHIPGIDLNSLLVLRPVSSHVPFEPNTKDLKSGKYVSSINFTNPNDSGSVAFKIKTNSPKRYNVKPSSGCIAPGEKCVVTIYLTPGFEDSVFKDRFLVLYQSKNDDRDLVEFWKTHIAKDMHYEYKIRAKFISPEVSERADSLLSPTSNTPAPSALTKSSPADAEIERLNRELIAVKHEAAAMKREIIKSTSKFNYSLALNAFVLVLLFYIIYRLSVLTTLVSYQYKSKEL